MLASATAGFEGTAQPCAGDCSNDGRVTVDELILGVRIALGVADADSCRAFDRDQRDGVTIDELLAAVADALGGCQPSLAISSAAGPPGLDVPVSIRLHALGRTYVAIRGLTFEFDDRALLLLDCSSLLPGKTINLTASPRRVVLDLSGDESALPDGPLLSCTFTVRAQAPLGTSSLHFISALLIDGIGAAFEPVGLDGGVVIQSPPTATPTVTSTNTPTSSQTPTPSPPFTPTSTSGQTVDLDGNCLQPGTRGLIACDEGTQITASRCECSGCSAVPAPACCNADLRAACLRDPQARVRIGEARTGPAGDFSIRVAADQAGEPLLFEAEVADAVIYRVLDLFPVGSNAARGGAATVHVEIDPSSTGTLALLGRGGPPCAGVTCKPRIEDTSDSTIAGLIAAARQQSNGGTAYANTTAMDAIGVGSSLAAQVAGFSLSQSLLRAQDGTVYQILIAAGVEQSPGQLFNSGGGEVFRLTTLAASAIQSTAVCFSPPGVAGDPITALAGAPEAPQAFLHPLAATDRTDLLSPEAVQAVSFDSSFGGRLTLGIGASAINVCANAADCTDISTAPLFSADSFSGQVPPACIAAGLHSACGLDVASYAFGLPPMCMGYEPTFASTICSPLISDGLTMRPGNAIVFVYRGVGPSSPFSIAFAGFEIDLDGVNGSGCFSSPAVISGLGRSDSVPPAP